MYSLIIFLLLVLPIAIKNYLSNSEYGLPNRLLNIVVSILIFSIFFEEFRILFWGFIDRGIILSVDEISRCQCTYLYCSFIKVLYTLACIYISASSLGLGRGNNKSRIRFLKHLKYIWIVLGLYFTNWAYVLNTEQKQEPNFVELLLLVLFGTGTVMFAIYLFYNSKFISRLFYSKENPVLNETLE